MGRAVARMDGGQRSRQEAVAREREQGARDREGHAADVAEHRHAGPRQDDHPSRRPEDPASDVGQRRRRRRERRPEYTLGHELQGNVEESHGAHGQEDGARDRAGDVAHLAARRQCALDAREREDEQRGHARDGGGSGRRGPDEPSGFDEEGSDRDEGEERKQLGDGKGGDEGGPLPHADDVDRGEDR